MSEPSERLFSVLARLLVKAKARLVSEASRRQDSDFARLKECMLDGCQPWGDTDTDATDAEWLRTWGRREGMGDE